MFFLEFQLWLTQEQKYSTKYLIFPYELMQTAEIASIFDNENQTILNNFLEKVQKLKLLGFVALKMRLVENNWHRITGKRFKLFPLVIASTWTVSDFLF